MGTPLSYDIPSMVERGTTGLLGVETATGYWGLSTYNHYENPIFLFNDNSQSLDGYQATFIMTQLFVPQVNSKNTIKLSDTLWITDREQTVCDMIRYNRHEFHLFETVLSAYEDGEVDINRMEKIAEQYDILDKLRETYQRALGDIDFSEE